MCFSWNVIVSKAHHTRNDNKDNTVRAICLLGKSSFVINKARLLLDTIHKQKGLNGKWAGLLSQT